MSSQKIYTKTKSHSDTDGDLIPEMDNGTDTHNFTIPDGKKYSGYSVREQSGTLFSGYSVKSSPTIGSTGRQKIKIDWWYAPFGKIVYKVEAKAQEIEQEQEKILIWYGEDGWENNARDAIEQGLDFKILMKGPEALKYIKLLFPDKNRNVNTSNAIEPVSASIVIGVVILGVVFFGALTAILIYGMSNGYNAKVDAGAETPIGDADLEIDLTKA